MCSWFNVKSRRKVFNNELLAKDVKNFWPSNLGKKEMWEWGSRNKIQTHTYTLFFFYYFCLLHI